MIGSNVDLGEWPATRQLRSGSKDPYATNIQASDIDGVGTH